MEVMEMPLVPLETSLNEAFDTMKREGRSAILALETATGDSDSGGNRIWLIEDGPVILGISRGAASLAAIDPGTRTPVHLPVLQEFQERNIDPSDFYATPREVEQLLDDFVRSFTLVEEPTATGPKMAGAGAVMVTLITRSEDLRYRLESGPGTCACKRCHKSYDAPRLPKNCRRCGFDQFECVND